LPADKGYKCIEIEKQGLTLGPRQRFNHKPTRLTTVTVESVKVVLSTDGASQVI
jgi:hypothetical protein